MISCEQKTLFHIKVFTAVFVLFFCANAMAGERPYIGMQPQELPAEALVALGLGGATIIMIRDVGRHTPAGGAGVRPGDILLSMNDKPVSSLAELIDLVGTLVPGDTVPLSVSRGGEELDLALEVGSWPAAQALQKPNVGQVPALGLTMIGLTKEVREQFSLRWDTSGLLVSLVDPSKGISEIIQRGDVIVQANQQDVWLPEQVIDIYRAAKDAGQRQIVLLLERSEGNALVLLPVK